MENQQSDDDEQASQLVKVYPEEIMGKFRSKSDIYNYLSQKWQLFLPPFKEAKIGRFGEELVLSKPNYRAPQKFVERHKASNQG